MNAIQKSIVALACTSAAIFSSNAFAADRQTFTVAADIQGVCKFTSAGYFMGFNPIDATSGLDATQTLPVSYLCTNGTPATSIMIGNAASGVTLSMGNTAGGSSLPVTLTWTTPATAGTGFAPTATPITFDVKGTILAANLQTAAAGRYVSRSTISIMP